MNATVLEGERAELECQPKNAEWEVHWFKDGKPVDALPELAARAERPGNGSLVLRRASSVDVGEFACRVRAPHAAEHSASAFLDVQCEYGPTLRPSEARRCSGAVAVRRQGEGGVRAARALPAPRQTGQPQLPLQRQSAAYESALGERRLPVRPLQRARGLLQQKWQFTFQPGASYCIHLNIHRTLVAHCSLKLSRYT